MAVASSAASIRIDAIEGRYSVGIGDESLWLTPTRLVEFGATLERLATWQGPPAEQRTLTMGDIEVHTSLSRKMMYVYASGDSCHEISAESEQGIVLLTADIGDWRGALRRHELLGHGQGDGSFAAALGTRRR